MKGRVLFHLFLFFFFLFPFLRESVSYAFTHAYGGLSSSRNSMHHLRHDTYYQFFIFLFDCLTALFSLVLSIILLVVFCHYASVMSSSASRTPVVMCGSSARRFPSPSPSPLMTPPVVPSRTRTRTSASGSIGSDERADVSTTQFIRSLTGPPLCSRPLWHFLNNCNRLMDSVDDMDEPVLTAPRLNTSLAEVLGFTIRQIASVNSQVFQRPRQQGVKMPEKPHSKCDSSCQSSSAPSSSPSPIYVSSGAVSATATPVTTAPESSRRSFEFKEDKRASVSLETYIFMWICQCDCELELTVVALLYLDRLANVLPLSRQNCHRLWAAAMVVAIKTYSDFVKTFVFINVSFLSHFECCCFFMGFFDMFVCF